MRAARRLGPQLIRHTQTTRQRLPLLVAFQRQIRGDIGLQTRTYVVNMASEGVDKAGAAKGEEVDQTRLPPLSSQDFRVFNHMADHMDLFHTRFRQTWNLLWKAATSNKRPQGMTLRQFLQTGLDFAEHLTAHHTIEERYIFPVLAKKMREFDPKHGDLLQQHARIHDGLERFEGYLRQCQGGEVDFEMAALRERMESWGGILWTHLDEEVETLGAENMRRYWTKEEMRMMPM